MQPLLKVSQANLEALAILSPGQAIHAGSCILPEV
jgi:hypothetical protein